MQAPDKVLVYDVQLSHPERTGNGPPYFRDSPLQILGHDLALILRHASEIPNIFLPLPQRGGRQQDVTAVGLIAQVAFVFTSLLVTAVLIWAFSVGFPTPILALGLLILSVKGISRLQGTLRRRTTDNFDDEAWLFVNGVGTSTSGLQLILDDFHRVFHRQVTGIHNKTYGMFWDLVECMLQRDLLWPTEDVRVGYQTICRYIRDPAKNKVVLMAHSQGGIILSTWVDQLLADFNTDDLQKVEIYTFASAANHFAVPSTTTPSGDKRYVFGIVEHFVNTRDYVSLIGLIEFAPAPPEGTVTGELPPKAAEGRFAGRIFKRIGHTGHLLLTHYLKIDDSFLDHPTAEKYSQLCKYKGGNRAAAEPRMWKHTEQTAVPAVVAHPIPEPAISLYP